MKRIFSLVVFIYSTMLSVYPSETVNGLLFNSSAQEVSKRSSLSIFNNEPEEFTNSFDITFDFSIWDINQFGFILRIINNINQEVDLAFVNFRGDDNLYLDFHSPITHRSVEIPFKKEFVLEKRLIPIKISFNLKDDKAEIFFMNSIYKCESVGLTNPSHLKFVYGLWGLNLDVPQMLIKNIGIYKEKKPKYFFPLLQSDGVRVCDDSGKEYGIAKNPNWIINHYHFWNKKATFLSDSAKGLAFDNTNERVLFLNNNSLSAYYLQSNIKRNYLENMLPKSMYFGNIINIADNKFILYCLGENKNLIQSMATINLNDNNIEYTNPKLENELLDHNCFVSESEKTIYLFGGHGNHLFSNLFYTYNVSHQSWDKVDFKGDVITPRYGAVTGKGLSPSKILLMGGCGNESGKQEHGGRQFYDLYEVDLKLKNVKKLWDIQKTDYGFAPCGDIILNKEKTYFYTLCSVHKDSKEAIQLYKFSLRDGSFEIVSDSIQIKPVGLKTFVNLFYSEKMHEFYAVVRKLIKPNNSEVQIYSLMSPPIGIETLSKYSQKNNFHQFIILGFLAFCILASLLYLILFKRKKYLFKINSDSLSQINNKYSIPKSNAIFVFGDFQVLDKFGRDISHLFSSKLKSLFALILFHSSEESKGISTEKLTLELWPDKDITAAKNIRGVTINRLRTNLEDIDGITLIFKNSKWSFEIEDSLYCDYLDYLSNFPRTFNNEDVKHKMSRLYQILNRGALFPNIQVKWIDIFKKEHEEKLEKLLGNYISLLYAQKNFSQVILYSDLILMINPTNEKIVELSIMSLQKMNKGEQALTLYKNFVTKHLDSIGNMPTIKKPNNK